jgi:hypothetical protein
MSALRAFLAERLRWHLHFINKLLLFPEIEDQKHYEYTILGTQQAQPLFAQVSNLFHPRTLTDSLVHDGSGEVPGIKGLTGKWDLRGHRSRVVRM